MNARRASRSRRSTLLIGFAMLVALVFWSARRAGSTVAIAHGHSGRFGLAFAISFVVIFWQAIAANLERPHVVTPAQAAKLASLKVAVLVPLYNEDPEVAKACIGALFASQRLPQMITVVDDGSKLDYADLRAFAQAQADASGIELIWERQPNQGKRHAQGAGIKRTPDADIYVTVDSDGILDPEAIDEVLKPFADPRVKSVAGVVLALNNRTNLLTRMTDLWFVAAQLNDRSSMSAMGAVLVNSGVLAAYDGPMVRNYLDGYLNESFFGRRVEFSDDSMLTMYALVEGRAVQQPTAFAFTVMPETVDHHVRQYVRWMRGSTVRAWWRFRYLPLTSYGYWAHLWAWVQLAMATFIFAVLFVVGPLHGRFSLYLLLIPLLIGYGQALRYLTFRRDDESLASQIGTVLLSPIATLWCYLVLRPIRWYATFTCRRMSWGTRNDVEVGLA